jgi:methylthioribose-1-phosphate isomerase
MKVQGRHYRTIWVDQDGWSVRIIDQTCLPHEFTTVRLRTLEDAAHAIVTMQVRGAPLIGAAAAYGVALHMRTDPSERALQRALEVLLATRPTAVNLRWALEAVRARLEPLTADARRKAAYEVADAICDADVATNEAIGRHGLALLRDLAATRPPGEALNILTHCNAGWLATVDWGTATAPIYMAHDTGLRVHVWVDETRPRNQGAALTAFELGEHGVAHTVVVDNAGGHLMQHGAVDLCIVGTDRTTASGDVGNKIGTYLKALAAVDNDVPFYVAAPSTSIDWTLDDGVAGIPIEQRDTAEVTTIRGRTADGHLETVRLVPAGTPAANYAFDVTPSRLVSGLITERGVAQATHEGLIALFPEHAAPGAPS